MKGLNGQKPILLTVFMEDSGQSVWFQKGICIEEGKEVSPGPVRPLPAGPGFPRPAFREFLRSKDDAVLPSCNRGRSILRMIVHYNDFKGLQSLAFERMDQNRKVLFFVSRWDDDGHFG